MELKSKHFQNTGKKFILTCYLEEGTKPLVFEWHRNGGIISSVSSVRIETSEEVSSLTIDRLQSTDSGNYSCSVSNQFGSDSQSTVLLVKGSASFVSIAIVMWRIGFGSR